MLKDAKTDGMGERVRQIILSDRESKLIERKRRQKDRQIEPVIEIENRQRQIDRKLIEIDRVMVLERYKADRERKQTKRLKTEIQTKIEHVIEIERDTYV